MFSSGMRALLAAPLVVRGPVSFNLDWTLLLALKLIVYVLKQYLAKQLFPNSQK